MLRLLHFSAANLKSVPDCEFKGFIEMGRAVEYRHGFVSEDSGSRFHVSGADTVVQNGHYTENGYSQSSVEYTGSTIDLSGSIKEVRSTLTLPSCAGADKKGMLNVTS